MSKQTGDGVGGAAQRQTCRGAGSSPARPIGKKALRLKLRKLDSRIGEIVGARRSWPPSSSIPAYLKALDAQRKAVRRLLKRYVPPAGPIKGT